ncbi:MAG: DUF4303 domain-containing protein [Deltaproteobacteria bacterium]|nr:DUF4303 domain-containing protein [Deltaproteobacteria bacterium]
MDFELLQTEIVATCRQAFRDIRVAHPNEEICAFALYSDDGAMTVCPAFGPAAGSASLAPRERVEHREIVLQIHRVLALVPTQRVRELPNRGCVVAVDLEDVEARGLELLARERRAPVAPGNERLVLGRERRTDVVDEEPTAGLERVVHRAQVFLVGHAEMNEELVVRLPIRVDVAALERVLGDEEIERRSRLARDVRVGRKAAVEDVHAAALAAHGPHVARAGIEQRQHRVDVDACLGPTQRRQQPQRAHAAVAEVHRLHAG